MPTINGRTSSYHVSEAHACVCVRAPPQLHTCDSIVTQVRSPLLHLPLESGGHVVWVCGHEEVQHSGAAIQHVHRVLVVSADGEVGMPVDCALGWGEVPSHKLQQGGLAGSIGPHKGHSAVAIDAKLQILQKRNFVR